MIKQHIAGESEPDQANTPEPKSIHRAHKSTKNVGRLSEAAREWISIYGNESIITKSDTCSSTELEPISRKDEIRILEKEVRKSRFGRSFVLNYTTSPMGGTRIACSVRNGGGIYGSSRILNSYTLAYIHRGSGKYQNEHGYKQDIRSGDCILVYPGLKHWYGPDPGTKWDEIFIDFGGTAFDLMSDSGFFAEFPPVFQLTPIEFWSEKIRLAIGERNNGDEDKMYRELLRIQNLLVDIKSAFSGKVDEDTVWSEFAKKAVNDNSSVQEAARCMGMRYSSFRKKFRKVVGMSPGKYKCSLKMERACYLLGGSTNKIMEISDELGYCDQYQFSRQFKNIIGCSPSEYRRRLHGVFIGG